MAVINLADRRPSHYFMYKCEWLAELNLYCVMNHDPGFSERGV